MTFAGIQGFQRVYRAMLLARTNPVEGWFVTLSTKNNYTNSGETTGSVGLVASADTGLIQMQRHLTIQKSEALRLRLQMSSYGEFAQGQLSITDLTLQLGVKPGLFKLPSAQRF